MDPKSHEIKDEMKRVQEFYKKIEDTKSTPVINTNESNINKEACERMIKNIINSGNNNKSDKSDTNYKKVKKSVPIPDSVHINWQKNINK